jgi:hypothetical protein
MFSDDFFSPFKIDDFYPLTIKNPPMTMLLSLLLMFSVAAMAFLLLLLSLLLLASI